MKLWPESKVLALMEIAFHYGCLKRNELWLDFKVDKLTKSLKYVNPDKRCTYPVNLDVIDYCWEYADKIDKGEEINMNELCEGCEFFREEVKNES